MNKPWVDPEHADLISLVIISSIPNKSATIVEVGGTGWSGVALYKYKLLLKLKLKFIL